MKKNYLLICIFVPFIVSCSSGNNLNTNVIATNSSENKTQDKNDLINKPGENIEPGKLVTQPADNVEPGKLVTKPDDNVEPGKLVTKPDDNVEPGKLVTQPGENVEPGKLVTQPGENVEPGKIVDIKNSIGFTDISFTGGKNQVVLKVNFSEFRIASILSEDSDIESLDFSIKMDNSTEKSVKVEKNNFRNQKSFTLKLKDLKDLNNLTVMISAKDINNQSISQQELINEEVKGNKSKEVSFSRTKKNDNSSSTNNGNSSSNSSSTNNSSGSSNNSSSQSSSSTSSNSSSNNSSQTGNNGNSTTNGNSSSNSSSSSNSNSSSNGNSSGNNGKNK